MGTPTRDKLKETVAKGFEQVIHKRGYPDENNHIYIELICNFSITKLKLPMIHNAL